MGALGQLLLGRVGNAGLRVGVRELGRMDLGGVRGRRAVPLVERGFEWEMVVGEGQTRGMRRGTVLVTSPLVAGGRNAARTGKKGT